MSQFEIGLVSGLMIGVAIGVILMACMFMAHDDHNNHGDNNE